MNISNALFFAIGTWEWAIIAGVAVLFFGTTKLPRLARSLGQSVTEFKKGVKSDDSDEGEGEGEPKPLPREEA